MIATGFMQEVLQEQRDVLSPLADRRDGNVDDVETVEEVLSELPRPDPFNEDPVGRGNDPNIYLRWLLPRPNTLNRAAGEKVQQEGLQAQADLTHLVQEDGAVVRRLERPSGVTMCVGEASPNVTE